MLLLFLLFILMKIRSYIRPKSRVQERIDFLMDFPKDFKTNMGNYLSEIETVDYFEFSRHILEMFREAGLSAHLKRPDLLFIAYARVVGLIHVTKKRVVSLGEAYKSFLISVENTGDTSYPEKNVYLLGPKILKTICSTMDIKEDSNIEESSLVSSIIKLYKNYLPKKSS